MMQLIVKPTVAVVVVLAIAGWGFFEILKRGMAAIFEAMMESEG